MKLIRFGQKGKEKPGVLINGQRKDCSQYFKDWNRDFFVRGGLEELQNLLERKEENLPNIAEEERWGACIARPGMLMCIGLNFSDHAIESGMEIPKEPVLFMKATNTLAGPYDDVIIPPGSQKTDWEIELGIVIQKDAYRLKSKKEAEECIAGYCVINDVSERAFQLEMGGQWVKGKSCPGFSPAGPYLRTKDEIDNALNLSMKLSVNGTIMQNGNSKTMIFNPYHLVHYLSQFMLIEAGDIVSSGTPLGVGLGMNPPQYLKPNDVVELSIEGLGNQKQTFRAYAE